MVDISWLPELLYNDEAFAMRDQVRDLVAYVKPLHDREMFLLKIKFETLFCLPFSLYL